VANDVSPETGAVEGGQPDAAAETSAGIHSVNDAVARARAEFERAQQVYEKYRGQAVEQLRQVRQKTVGEVMDEAVALVRKYPGPSLLIGLLIGFFLGRKISR
jgi:ElaB/YqjD/DUF883 family membrane-anchored ribosome-binding protein